MLTSYTNGEVWLYDSMQIWWQDVEKPGAADLPGVYWNVVVNGGLLVAVIAVQQQTGYTECALKIRRLTAFPVSSTGHQTLGNIFKYINIDVSCDWSTIFRPWHMLSVV